MEKKKSKLKKYWEPSPFVLAQDAHIFIAISACLVAVAKAFPFWYGALAVLGFAIFKEALIDKLLEDQPFFGPWQNSGFVDFCFYVVGVILAVLIIFL